VSLDVRRARGAAFVLLLVLGAFALRCHGLAEQPLTEDDLLVATSAGRYVESGQLGPTEWNHPALRSLLVWLALDTGGAEALALKAPSLILGTAAIALLVFVVVGLGGSSRAALVAGGLLAVDGIHVAFSRQAVQEVYMSCFALAGVLAALRYRSRRSPAWLLVAGAFFGLGLASKWDVAGPLAVTIAFLAWEEGEGLRGSAASGRALGVALAVGGVATAVYLATFLPWFGRGYGIGDWLRLHADMLAGSAEHTGAHNPYLDELDHRPWLWFLKPVSYASFTTRGNAPYVLAGFANPLVWLAIWPAIVSIARREGAGQRERLLLVGIFGASYAPFLLSGRPVWAHSALSVLPWGIAALALALDRWLPKRRSLALYLGAVALVALPLYLMATGAGLDSPLLRPIVMSLRPSGEG